MFFVVFVLMAQFVLVNVVVAVLMKHLEVCSTTVLVGFRRDVIPAVTQAVVAGVLLLFLFFIRRSRSIGMEFCRLLGH